MVTTLQHIGAAFLTYEAYLQHSFHSIGLSAAHELPAKGFGVVLLWVALVTFLQNFVTAAVFVKPEYRISETRIVVLDLITAAPHEIETALEFTSALPIDVWLTTQVVIPSCSRPPDLVRVRDCRFESLVQSAWLV
ncbi:uncharacterized protein F4817DRAFT_319135 [Daldinia loculata]|uniref:uncharacterized protein n=1 Tax=Daldinia loculata TaxID=103429 RepID=UPI0020C4AF0D|nr:uncharacterized protein F4817DRAFT_319135 [Daldinia loculata]KAI1644113.1 hypothetical protein F4817DRAFT_319135 [Daldinia loculata]